MKSRKNIPVSDLDGEIWTDIKHFEGLYAISNKQRVKSLERKSNNGIFTIKEKILRAGFHKYGYLKFTLCKAGKFYYMHLHNIVAATFIPNPNNFNCINHIDCNPANNSIENLEWCTSSQNTRHALKLGRLSFLGEKNGRAKLKEYQVIMLFNSNPPYDDICKKFGISKQTVTDIKSGRRWCEVTGKRHPDVKKRIRESILTN